MANVNDVAAFILQETGVLSTMKLQKLVYYSQALFLKDFDKPLFSERIEAWVNGPVVPELYEAHKGQSVVSLDDLHFSTDPVQLDVCEQSTVKKVLSVLGSSTGAELSNLTHAELPWRNARTGLKPDERSKRLIDTGAIRAYYSSACVNNPLFA